MVGGLSTLPILLVGPWGGVWGDRVNQRTKENCRPPGVAALVGQELDVGQRSDPILNFVTTFQYLALDFVSTSPLLFTTCAPPSPHLWR
jgi:hypothetical protein